MYSFYSHLILGIAGAYLIRVHCRYEIYLLEPLPGAFTVVQIIGDHCSIAWSIRRCEEY